MSHTHSTPRRYRKLLMEGRECSGYRTRAELRPCPFPTADVKQLDIDHTAPTRRVLDVVQDMSQKNEFINTHILAEMLLGVNTFLFLRCSQSRGCNQKQCQAIMSPGNDRVQPKKRRHRQPKESRRHRSRRCFLMAMTRHFMLSTTMSLRVLPLPRENFLNGSTRPMVCDSTSEARI